MNERDWIVLKTLFEEKNITKTSQRLFISQPSLTAQIRRMEDEFGVKLIYRAIRGIRFTQEGEYLADYAKKMVRDAQTLREDLLEMSESMKGVLRIGAPQYIIKYKLPDLLGSFKTKYPEVDFEIVTAWSRNTINLVNAKEIHIGFVRNDYDWPAQEKHLLMEEEIHVAARDAFQFEDLPKLPMIDYRTDYSYKLFLENWWRENFHVPPKICMRVGSIDICKDMILNGLGYGFLPRNIFGKSDTVYTLALRDQRGQPIIRNTWMIYHKEMLGMKTSRTFIEFVRNYDLLR